MPTPSSIPIHLVALVSLLVGLTTWGSLAEARADVPPSYLVISVVEQGSETPLHGIEVVVFEAAEREATGHVVERFTTTGAAHEFRDLVAGSWYRIEVTDPASTFLDPRDTAVRSFGPIQDGYEIPATIGMVRGTVIRGTMIFDGVGHADPPWPMDVELLELDGSLVRSVAAGHHAGWLWAFDDVAPGRYMVRAVDPSGRRRTQYLAIDHVPAYSPARAQIVEIADRSSIVGPLALRSDTVTNLYMVRRPAFDPQSLDKYGQVLRHSEVRVDPGEFEPGDVEQSIVWTYHGEIVAKDVTTYAVPALPSKNLRKDIVTVTVTTALSTGEPPLVEEFAAYVRSPELGCTISVDRPVRMTPGGRLSVLYEGCAVEPDPVIRWSLDGKTLGGSRSDARQLVLKRGWVGKKIGVYASARNPGYQQAGVGQPLGRVVAARS